MNLRLPTPYRLSMSSDDVIRQAAVNRMGLSGMPPGPGCYISQTAADPPYSGPLVPVGTDATGTYSTTCAFFANAPLPDYYVNNAAVARANGYSVPFMAGMVGTGAGVYCVNPDGTIVRVDHWQTYPPVASYGDDWNWPGSAATYHTFKPPPMDVWFKAISDLGVASVAATEAAYQQAAQQYAQQAGQSAAPGVLPSSYGQPPATGGGGSPPVSSSGTGQGNLSFVTSRGGNQLQPGDTWTIRITGARPNSPVSVFGIHPDGTEGTAGEGNTDPSGNFVLKGQIQSSAIGTWQETWSVGGQAVGSFSFTVSSGAPSGGGGSGSGGGPTGGYGGGSASGSGGPSSGTGGTQISPWLIAGIAAAVLIGVSR